MVAGSKQAVDSADAMSTNEDPSTRGLDDAERKAIPPFAAIRAFEAIGSSGGIRRAALALAIDHAAVSRHLRGLELWTGVPLINRSPGAGGRLTEAGERYHKAISRGLAEIARASIDIQRRSDDKHLLLWCAPVLASEWLSGRLQDFAAHYPDVDLEIQPMDVTPEIEPYNVDAHLHWVVDADKRDLDPEFRSIPIARTPILAVASPRFLASAPLIERPADLLKTTLVHEADFDQWRCWFAAHGVDAEGALSGSKFWQAHLTLAAAKRGLGVALGNSLLVDDALRSGELVSVGSWDPVHLGTYMFTARRSRWRHHAIASFRRWVEATIKE